MHRVYTAPEPGLVGYWQLNESSGTTAIDLIGSFQGSLTGFEFNETSGWTTSTAPIAAGVSTSIGNFTSGTANLGTVSLTTVDGFDNPVDLVVTRLESDPNTNSGTVGNIVAGAYWVVKLFGDPGTLSTNLTFSLSPGSVSSADIAMPSNLKLYRRSSGSDGNWTEVASASSATEATVTFEGVTSFSQFTIGSESSPLPVQLSSFTVIATGLNAELRWRTESETGNYGFDIERRLVHGSQFMVQGHEVMNHEPGTWSRIGFVQGAGTSTSPQDYTFTDKPDAPGRYAYRIKQIDHSGAFTYTSSLEVVIGLAPLEFTLGQNYPNPFNPTTTIEFTIPADGRVVLKVYDLTGREVATLVDQEMKAGVYQQVVFDASRLASGVYVAGLQAAGRQLMSKLILLK
ncbi:MAG: T9SS type A sorting domain-containing protein [Ignavibacterium sp.]